MAGDLARRVARGLPRPSGGRPRTRGPRLEHRGADAHLEAAGERALSRRATGGTSRRGARPSACRPRGRPRRGAPGTRPPPSGRGSPSGADSPGACSRACGRAPSTAGGPVGRATNSSQFDEDDRQDRQDRAVPPRALELAVDDLVEEGAAVGARLRIPDRKRRAMGPPISPESIAARGRLSYVWPRHEDRRQAEPLSARRASSRRRAAPCRPTSSSGTPAS